MKQTYGMVKWRTMSKIDDSKIRMMIPEIKIDGTLKNVEIGPEFLEWMKGSNKNKNKK